MTCSSTRASILTSDAARRCGHPSAVRRDSGRSSWSMMPARIPCGPPTSCGRTTCVQKLEQVGQVGADISVVAVRRPRRVVLSSLVACRRHGTADCRTFAAAVLQGVLSPMSLYAGLMVRAPVMLACSL